MGASAGAGPGGPEGNRVPAPDCTRERACSTGCALVLTTAEQALQRMAEQNEIRRMHTPQEVAGTVARLVAERPLGCTFVMDRDPAAFVD